MKKYRWLMENVGDGKKWETHKTYTEYEAQRFQASQPVAKIESTKPVQWGDVGPTGYLVGRIKDDEDTYNFILSPYEFLGLLLAGIVIGACLGLLVNMLR